MTADRFREASVKVRSISTFLHALQEDLKSPELWVFRGQKEWDWALQPKRGRSSPADEEFDLRRRVERADAARLHREFARTAWWLQDRQVYEDWQAEAVALVDPSLPRPSSELEWLALGQHYGLSTRRRFKPRLRPA